MPNAPLVVGASGSGSGQAAQIVAIAPTGEVVDASVEAAADPALPDGPDPAVSGNSGRVQGEPLAGGDPSEPTDADSPVATVPATFDVYPVRVCIAGIDVDAPVVVLGLNGDGTPEVLTISA